MREPGPERPGSRDSLNSNPGGTTHDEEQSIRWRQVLRPGGTRPRTPLHHLRSHDRERRPFLRGVWLVAALWTFFAALAHVLWRGFRYGDWSAFGRYEVPTGDDGERFDWATKTGRYAWRRDLEDAGASRSRPGRPLSVEDSRPAERRPANNRPAVYPAAPCAPERSSLAGRGAAEGRPGGCPLLSNTHQEETT